ncbi:MAG TPA: HlyD family efflux transporter periplasmic adaptor subunit [Pirellulaceae bacterium]|nr:HlyD family efflux transporter periplasmic adaptor subunit [Pirellulaceae bacterium]
MLRFDQSRAKSLAVSGVDQLDRRSAQVASLERLASAVARSGEPVEWPRPPLDLPPQIDQALQEHLDIAHCRRLIVAPLCPRAAKDSGFEPAIRGVLIAESFDERKEELGFRERTGDVARHGGAALLAALEHHDLPLLPLQVKLGRLFRRLQQRRIAVALFLVIALAVIGLLVAIPADLTIEARGTLQPQVRKHLFAPVEGIVEKVQADHGAHVAQGDPLLLLRDPRLELDDSRVSGELQTAQARLIAVQTQRSSRSTSPDTREQGRELAAEEEQLKEQVRGLEAQHALLRKLRGELSIASPIDGVVLTWNTTELLQDRPVKQGQRLVTVADPTGPWVVELRIPDADLGHVLRAQEQSGRELPVSFLLATDPAITYRGQIERVAVATDVAEDSPAALTIVRFTGQPPAGALAGTSVTARIHCGAKPIGYVWLHDLIDAIRTQVLF